MDERKRDKWLSSGVKEHQKRFDVTMLTSEKAGIADMLGFVQAWMSERPGLKPVDVHIYEMLGLACADIYAPHDRDPAREETG